MPQVWHKFHREQKGKGHQEHAEMKQKSGTHLKLTAAIDENTDNTFSLYANYLSCK